MYPIVLCEHRMLASDWQQGDRRDDQSGNRQKQRNTKGHPRLSISSVHLEIALNARSRAPQFVP